MGAIHLNVFLTIISLSITAGVDWKSYPARQYTYNRTILEGLKHTPTLEENKIDLTENDMDLLCAADGLYSVERTRAEEKLSRKIGALQCISGLVLQENLELLQTVNGYHKDHIAQNDDDLTHLLALFYTLKTSVRSCFWRIHIKLKAYTSQYSHRESPRRFFSDLGEHIDEIGEYCQRCVRDGLMVLPQTSQPEDSEASPELVDQINVVLNEPKKLFKLLYYKFDYWGEHMTRTIDHVCESFSGVLWTEAKSRMIESRQGMMLESMNNSWHLIPYEYVQFHTIVLRIIRANVMYRALVHLKTYAAYLERHVSLDGPEEIPYDRLTRFWLMLREPLSSAVDLLDLRDDVLWSLTYHMSITETIDVETLHSMISHMHNFLGREYLQLGVPLSQWGLEHLDWQLDETTDLKSEEVTKNTNLLRYYVGRVRATFEPVDIAFVRFFLNGQTRQPHSFRGNSSSE